MNVYCVEWKGMNDMDRFCKSKASSVTWPFLELATLTDNIGLCLFSGRKGSPM